jgi:hypothetical protein
VHDQEGLKGPSQEFFAIALERVVSLQFTHRQLATVLIELTGEEAESEVDFTAFHRVPAPGLLHRLFALTGSERGVYDWQGPGMAP